MTSFNMLCTGPGPHQPVSGVVSVSDQPQNGRDYGRCAAAACIKPVDVSVANIPVIQANIVTHLGQIETWLAANPNGAVLTAAQTAQLARMLVGLGRIVLGLTTTIGQAT